jgi:hypothetical protein
MSSFICFYAFSYSSVLVSWNLLSASCRFWLSMYSIISMKFSVITCRISSLRLFFWALLGSLASFIFVLLESGTGYPFSSFPYESCMKLFFGKEWFPSLFLIPLLHLVLCNYVPVTCFLSLGLILFCGCIGFFAKCVCAISVSGLGVINSQ